MPALVYFYRPIQAIPVIALVATVANLSRIFLWWSVYRNNFLSIQGLLTDKSVHHVERAAMAY
ncbi:hypothetical protein [Polynucleobacter necessarius]|uniref:hypothetical protein n=1 Tax=Polynucleobacter necessarius TaxID=576610 RepID=UPI0039E2206D